MRYLENKEEYLNSNFWKWFGKSKMVDKSGNPIVCYHGTNHEFDTFQMGLNISNDEGFYGRGFYFTFNQSNGIFSAKGEASYYGRNVMEVYLKVENPFDFSSLRLFKDKRIDFIRHETYIFLYNVAKKFPEISNKIFLKKKFKSEGDSDFYEDFPISGLVKLVDKYLPDLRVYEIHDRHAVNNRITFSGYFDSKKETVEYENSKGEIATYDDLKSFGRFDASDEKEVIEFCLLVEGLEKFEGLMVDYHPEGYMTRNSLITDAIKAKGHDGILQSYRGDEVVVFNPNQIKSATKNNGNFSLNSNNIYESYSEFINHIYESKNSKPAHDFDAKYGTNVSCDYDFSPYSEEILHDSIEKMYEGRDRNPKDIKKFFEEHLPFVLNLFKDKHQEDGGNENFNYNDLAPIWVYQGVISGYCPKDIISFCQGINGQHKEIKKFNQDMVEKIDPDFSYRGWIPSLDTIKELRDYFNI